MDKIRIKLEITVESDLNVNQVRERLASLTDPQHPLLTTINSTCGSIGANVRSYSASYDTVFGRKPGRQ